MPVSAHDVAAVLRDRLPGLGAVKLQKLLYYCQGHHLADLGEPLFEEAIYAWDMGPVVTSVWREQQAPSDLALSGPPLDEGALNTIGYVVSRYGHLTGRELTILTHGEDPWLQADADRTPSGSTRIEVEWIAEYFRKAQELDAEDDAQLSPDDVRRLVDGTMERVQQRAGQPDQVDSVEDVLAWARRDR